MIHHVHKDIVIKEMKLPKYLIPMALIVQTLEKWFMPFFYKNSKVVTCSESTKTDVEKLGEKLA